MNGARDGYGEYRGHNALADLIASTYSFNENAQRRFNERIKDALDGAAHRAPPAARENSVVRAMSIMYVRCVSGLGHIVIMT